MGELLSWMAGEHPSDEAFPFLGGDLPGYASLALGQLGPQHTVVAFDALIARIPAVSGLEAMPVVSAALGMAFPHAVSAEDTPFGSLDPRQHAGFKHSSPRLGRGSGRIGRSEISVKWCDRMGCRAATRRCDRICRDSVPN